MISSECRSLPVFIKNCSHQHVDQGHAEQDEDHEDDGKPGAQIPVAAFCKFLLDDVSDQEDLAAAQKVGDHEGGQGRYEHHGNAADHAGDA